MQSRAVRWAVVVAGKMRACCKTSPYEETNSKYLQYVFRERELALGTHLRLSQLPAARVHRSALCTPRGLLTLANLRWTASASDCGGVSRTGSSLPSAVIGVTLKTGDCVDYGGLDCGVRVKFAGAAVKSEHGCPRRMSWSG